MSRTTTHSFSSTLSLSKLFESANFVEELEAAIDEVGRREQRQRALPAALMGILVVSMSLFRHLSIPTIYRNLRSWYSRKRSACRVADVTDEALYHGRRRLGRSVLERLYHRLVSHIQIPPTFHGLRVFVADGMKLSTPDTESNESEFGRCKSSNGDTAAFPQLLAVCLVSTWSRHVMGVHLDRYDGSERLACNDFLDLLGEGNLLLLDRGFYATWLFKRFLDTSTHFLCRGSTSYNLHVIQKLGHGDYLVDISGKADVPKKGRRRRYQRSARARFTLRMIEYRVGRRGERIRLLTDLLDPQKYPPLDLAQLYHDRWEIELAFDEIKTHLAAPAQGTLNLPLRSQSSDGIRQETFGLFVAYNLVRSAIVTAAKKINEPPTQISFVASLNLIRSASIVLQALPDSKHEEVIRQLISEIAAQRLTRPRRPRRYHRAVRIKINRFPRKRSWHTQSLIDSRARVRLLDRYSRASRAA